MNRDNIIGKKIRQYRLARGFTQKQLGEMCGMADSAIRKYESGTITPKNQTLQRIADALGIGLSELLGISEAAGRAAGYASLFTDNQDDVDAELAELLEYLKNRPDLRMLFKLAKNAEPEDVWKAVRIIEALRNEESAPPGDDAGQGETE